MNLWSLILILLLLIGVTAMVFYLFYTASKNITQSSTGAMKSFAATIDPTNIQDSFTAPLMGQNAAGQTISQISCPAGSSINIVGALADIYDPYGECTNTPSDVLIASCNPQMSAGSCSSNADCYSNAWYCNTSGKCQLKSNIPGIPAPKNPNDQNTSSSIGAACPPGFIDPTTGACIDPNICYNVDATGVNQTCGPSSGNNCATRDASAYVASQCNGQQSCNISMAEFGPIPCNVNFQNATSLTVAELTAKGPFTDVSTQRDNIAYLGLPFTYGWNGNPYPDYSQNNGSQTTPTVNIGYKVHGIYTCVPNNE